LNSCSRLLALAAVAVTLALASPAAEALSVHAVYRTACSRELGVILRVEKRQIQMLRLDGTLVQIPRHEIVSVLYYPLSQLPLAEVPVPAGLPPLRVTTRQGGRVVDLVTGWPIDYSENQISFLLRSGKELVIDRDSIWSLSYEHGGAPAAPAPTRTDPVVFVHPQTSGFCADQRAPAEGARPAFAQQMLNDQIVIRRELDRLLEAYEQVLEYEQDQKFNPAPFLYRDRTMLGLWVSVLSRYGASSTRSNNFTPLLVDELALGPFRYQHEFLSGAAPSDMLLHHEAQSQIFYRFKAAYFHTSVFFDPNLLLVGTKYGWREEDFEDETHDDRVSETLGIEFGFDWGPLSIELYPAVLGQTAVQVGDFFDRYSEHNLWRAGFRLTFPTWRVQAAAGLASVDDHAEVETEVDGMPQFRFYETSWDYRYGLLNLAWRPLRALELELSGIARSTDYRAEEYEIGDVVSYNSFSLSTAAQATYDLSHRFSVGGHIIAEIQRRDAPGFDDGPRVLPRAGVFTGFWF
jgi:hypothetical protein